MNVFNFIRNFIRMHGLNFGHVLLHFIEEYEGSVETYYLPAVFFSIKVILLDPLIMRFLLFF